MTTRLRQIWRSMPLRLALLLVLLFAVVSLLSLAASYAVTRAAFEQTIRDDLAQDMAGFRAAPSARAVATLVEAESREADPGRLILSYVAPSGRLYGNGAIARDSEGYHLVSLRRDKAQYRGQYLALSTALYGGRLTIARSRAEVAALGTVFLNILWISLLPTMLVALSGGLVLARRSKRHVEVIRRTLDALTAGDLGARVQIGPRWSDDVVRIGETINQMAAAQERSVAALRQVSSDVAHDLKTPVQRVSLRLDDLAREVPPEGRAGELVAETQAEVAAIVSVFESLLHLAQVESGNLRDNFTPVDLADLVRTLCEMYETDVQEAGQTLICEVPPDAAIEVAGERNLLGQMIANLIRNALSHAGQGARIVVRLDGGENPVLSIRDNGPGIPAEERTRVLERLYRLDRSRNTPGNGLGLSLVAAIAWLHEAELTLSDAEPGLRVTIAF